MRDLFEFISRLRQGDPGTEIRLTTTALHSGDKQSLRLIEEGLIWGASGDRVFVMKEPVASSKKIRIPLDFVTVEVKVYPEGLSGLAKDGSVNEEALGLFVTKQQRMVKTHRVVDPSLKDYVTAADAIDRALAIAERHAFDSRQANETRVATKFRGQLASFFYDLKRRLGDDERSMALVEAVQKYAPELNKAPAGSSDLVKQILHDIDTKGLEQYTYWMFEIQRIVDQIASPEADFDNLSENDLYNIAVNLSVNDTELAIVQSHFRRRNEVHDDENFSIDDLENETAVDADVEDVLRFLEERRMERVIDLYSNASPYAEMILGPENIKRPYIGTYEEMVPVWEITQDGQVSEFAGTFSELRYHLCRIPGAYTPLADRKAIYHVPQLRFAVMRDELGHTIKARRTGRGIRSRRPAFDLKCGCGAPKTNGSGLEKFMKNFPVILFGDKRTADYLSATDILALANTPPDTELVEFKRLMEMDLDYPFVAADLQMILTGGTGSDFEKAISEILKDYTCPVCDQHYTYAPLRSYGKDGRWYPDMVTIVNNTTPTMKESTELEEEVGISREIVNNVAFVWQPDWLSNNPEYHGVMKHIDSIDDTRAEVLKPVREMLRSRFTGRQYSAINSYLDSHVRTKMMDSVEDSGIMTEVLAVCENVNFLNWKDVSKKIGDILRRDNTPAVVRQFGWAFWRALREQLLAEALQSEVTDTARHIAKLIQESDGIEKTRDFKFKLMRGYYSSLKPNEVFILQTIVDRCEKVLYQSLQSNATTTEPSVF